MSSERDAYAQAGVSTAGADSAVGALVSVLAGINPGRPSLAQLRSGHYANVLKVGENLGIAVSTDGVGSKVIIAEQLGRFDTVGIDCMAMNVNDLICVGATPLALVDYIAVEHADAQMLAQIAEGLKTGAEAAGVEIPGGELAQLPELIKGHPSPTGFDLVGAAFGSVALDAIVTGDAIAPGDVIIGLPSSGVHSNGLTLARKALLEDAGLSLHDTPPELGDKSVGEELLTPTEIYVKPILELLRSPVEVRGLAHLTSGGVLNLLRLNSGVGYEFSTPLPAQPVFGLIQAAAGVSDAEMHEVFNMGCGFCVIVPPEHADAADTLLRTHFQGAHVIGAVTADAGRVAVTPTGLVGDKDGLRAA
ncbi:MAG: phosphoribosylformylglycinamidine cyclo-ligase [Actinobacteria bacterium]|nr:phosphoribosylformylglycinamidine cyclo-ligase [Actinomycetota bacterium]